METVTFQARSVRGDIILASVVVRGQLEDSDENHNGPLAV